MNNLQNGSPKLAVQAPSTRGLSFARDGVEAHHPPQFL
jgi:hypothetical protein